MISPPKNVDRRSIINALLDEYIEMYSSRDDALTTHFSENFSGYTGSGTFLVHDLDEWIKITRQDFAQVPERINIEMVDKSLQDIGDDVVVATAFFHIHLPIENSTLSNEVARLVLIFHLEGDDWKIVHSGISIPYRFPAGEDEVYPIKSLQDQNDILIALVEERTRALQKSEALYRQLTEDTLDVHWKTDANLCITYISPSDETLRGFNEQEVIGHHIFEMFTEEGIETVKAVMQERSASEPSIKRSGYMSFEVQHRCKDGSLLWGEVFSKPDRDEAGNTTGYHGVTREITKRKALEAKVTHLAFYDPLTQLANRRLLMDRLSICMATNKRTNSCSALVFLDLDNFKPLNDIHGHAAGDLLLVEVASRLQACVREIDTVARFGGDEFVVLLGNLSSDKSKAIAEANDITEKLHINLSKPYLINMMPDTDVTKIVEHKCTVSIGVMIFNGYDESQDEIIKCADSAMYEAKDAGRNQIRFYSL